jgi:hypothetical protein
MLQARTDEKTKEGSRAWSIWGYVKKFYGLVMMFGLMKMLLLPGAVPEMMPRIKDPTNIQDLKKLDLNQTELDLITKAPTVEAKKVEMSKIVALKNKEKELA